MAIMSRTFSGDESFFKVMDRKAEQAGVTPSFLLRALIQDFLIDHDLVKGPDDLVPKFVRRSGGNA